MFPSRAATIAALTLLVSLTTIARVSAHDIPRDVTVQAFAKPEGRSFKLLVRVPLKAIMDIEFPRRAQDYVDLDRVDQSLRDAAMIWLARKVELYEDDVLVADPRILSVRMSLESDRSFSSYEAALAHLNGPRLTNDTSIFWEQGILDVLFDYPIRSDQSHFAVHMAFDRLGIRVVTALRFMPPGGVVRPLRARRRCRTRSARSQVAPGGAAVHHARVLPHPRRHRSPAVPVLPGDSVPPCLDAGANRHGVHRRAFDHADRRRLQLRAGRAVVSAARRDIDRDVDCLHGAGKHRRRATASSAG
jgi:hypothetical protein